MEGDSGGGTLAEYSNSFEVDSDDAEQLTPKGDDENEDSFEEEDDESDLDSVRFPTPDHHSHCIRPQSVPALPVHSVAPANPTDDYEDLADEQAATDSDDSLYSDNNDNDTDNHLPPLSGERAGRASTSSANSRLSKSSGKQRASPKDASKQKQPASRKPKKPPPSVSTYVNTVQEYYTTLKEKSKSSIERPMRLFPMNPPAHYHYANYSAQGETAVEPTKKKKPSLLKLEAKWNSSVVLSPRHKNRVPESVSDAVVAVAPPRHNTHKRFAHKSGTPYNEDMTLQLQRRWPSRPPTPSQKLPPSASKPASSCSSRASSLSTPSRPRTAPNNFTTTPMRNTDLGMAKHRPPMYNTPFSSLPNKPAPPKLEALPTDHDMDWCSVQINDEDLDARVDPKLLLAASKDPELLLKHLTAGEARLQRLWAEVHFPHKARTRFVLLHLRPTGPNQANWPTANTLAHLVAHISSLVEYKRLLIRLLDAVRSREALLQDFSVPPSDRLSKLQQLSDTIVQGISLWKKQFPWNKNFIYAGQDYLQSLKVVDLPL